MEISREKELYSQIESLRSQLEKEYDENSKLRKNIEILWKLIPEQHIGGVELLE